MPIKLSVSVAIGFAICSTVFAQPDRNELKIQLFSKKKTYFVDEPISFSLKISNPTRIEQRVPSYVFHEYQLTRRKIGDMESWHEPNLPEVPKKPPFLPRTILKPGESKVIKIDTYNPFGFGLSSIDQAGTWGIKCFFERLPVSSSDEVIVQVVEQPLKFPAKTPDRVRVAIKKLGLPGIESSRPGWTNVAHDDAMKELISIGPPAIPAILANLDNYQRRFSIIELCGALRIKSAVPKLLDKLRMEDTIEDSLIVAKLAEITRIDDGYSFHRRWFDDSTRKEAVRAYRKWWKENKPNK